MSRRVSAAQQLDLFAASPASSASQPVAAAAVPAELAALARRLPLQVYLGTSSWSFPGWSGLVYKGAYTSGQLARHGLAAYARHPLLRTVGIDRTYYAPLTARAFAAYAAAVPEAFRFLVKAHELCTRAYFTRQDRHASRRGEKNVLFLDPQYAIEQVVAPYLEGLGSKAGPLLWQFPPQDVTLFGTPDHFAERLHTFLTALPPQGLYAVELRTAGLLTASYVEALADSGVCHGFNVHPSMPPLQEQRRDTSPASAPALVLRWMLHPTQRYEAARRRYEPFNQLVDEDPIHRQAIVALCLEALTADRPVFVIANNKAEGSAPHTVFKLAQSLAEQLTP